MNKMIENEMNSMEFQEEEAPLFDFKQLWMLFVLNWRWFIASVVACVMIAFVVYDAVTAFQLDKRVRLSHPTQVKERKSKFRSYLFGKVVRSTIPKRLALILLAYLCQKYVCVHVNMPLPYIVTGVICFEQAWSILENESSCRSKSDGRLYQMLQRIMIDKTERHFDIELDDFKKNDNTK